MIVTGCIHDTLNEEGCEWMWRQDNTKINSIMPLSNELRYPSSNLSETFTHTILQPSL